MSANALLSAALRPYELVSVLSLAKYLLRAKSEILVEFSKYYVSVAVRSSFAGSYSSVAFLTNCFTVTGIYSRSD